jgi:hypothetical protein
MVTPGFRRLACSLPAVYALSLAGPERIDAHDSVFKSAVDMVPLTVTATGHSGNYRTGLTETDFVVFADGSGRPCRSSPRITFLSMSRSSSTPAPACRAICPSSSKGRTD